NPPRRIGMLASISVVSKCIRPITIPTKVPRIPSDVINVGAYEVKLLALPISPRKNAKMNTARRSQVKPSVTSDDEIFEKNDSIKGEKNMRYPSSLIINILLYEKVVARGNALHS